MDIVCLDLEGVLIPEVWISFAERTGIPELRRTTRDEPNYDKLMRGRIEILDRHKLGLREIQEVISGMEPLDGARAFLDQLRRDFQLIILSDTFYEFGMPFMAKLGMPTLFCHKLVVGEGGRIVDYKLRQADPKRRAIESLRALNFRTIAAGDSYNDTSMLGAADAGILFCAPENVVREFPQFPLTKTYAELDAKIRSAAASFG